MASTIDLSGLEHYIKAVERYGQFLKNFHLAMEEICKNAREFAKIKYEQHGHYTDEITVTYDNSGTKATIYAKGDQVAFFEFGTGKVGAGTYWGDLPRSDVPITVSWEYLYKPGKKVKVAETGDEGWWWDDKFHKGIPAEAEMWETAEHIRQNAHRIIQKYLNVKAVERV